MDGDGWSHVPYAVNHPMKKGLEKNEIAREQRSYLVVCPKIKMAPLFFLIIVYCIPLSIPMHN